MGWAVSRGGGTCDGRAVHTLSNLLQGLLAKVLTRFIYGLHSIIRRCPLRNSLNDLGEVIIIPWMVIGNFNALLLAQDKVGGLLVTNYKLQDLEKLVHG